MNISDFINQRKVVNYSQKDHLANLHQFLFFMKEVQFSDSDLRTTVNSLDRLPHHLADEHLIFYTPTNNNNNFVTNHEIIKNLKTHIGTEAIRAVRDSFSAIYPHNKITKTSTTQEIEKTKEQINNITRHFFDIMKYVSHLHLPNIPTFVPNGHFGSNLIAHYHESLVLLAMHNYSQFNIDEYSKLIEDIVPDNSLSDVKFIKLFASILYNDDKEPLMQVLFKKIDTKQFALACLSQTKNHKNFFVGLRLFLKNTDEHLNLLTKSDRDDFIQSMFSNLSLIGMLNNGYYLKTFTNEYKQLFSNFVESLPNNNNLLYELTHSQRFQNIDFEALVSKPIIYNSKLISSVLVRSIINKKSNISYLLNKLSNEKLISFNEIGKNLASLNDNSILGMLDLIRDKFTQQNILEMMNSDVKLFKNLEPLYREKNLIKTLDEKSKDEPISRARNKI